jgi:molybdate transport system substrate-binding protein
MQDGKRREIPADMYPPIGQAASVLKHGRNKVAAKSFLDFVKTEAARAILAKYGFSSPLQQSKAAK